jgi:hypothetical protein
MSGLSRAISLCLTRHSLFHRDRPEIEYKYVGTRFVGHVADPEIRPLYEKYGIKTTVWSALASGLLTVSLFVVRTVASRAPSDVY